MALDPGILPRPSAAASNRRDFCSPLAASGGGHFPVPVRSTGKRIRKLPIIV